MKLGILGFGLTGYWAARYALKSGWEVFISEKSPFSRYYNKLKKEFPDFKAEFGGHSDKLLKCDLILKSPGIHNDIPILKKSRKLDVPLTGELDFILRDKKPKKILAITGTYGKTTTTTLLGEMVKRFYPKTFICGNIGKPLSMYAEKIDQNTVLVMEVSSYQLEDAQEFRPAISMILNITPNHLEYHKTFSNYVRAKGRIFRNQRGDDICIFNYDDKNCGELSKKCPAEAVFFSRTQKLDRGAYFKNGIYYYLSEDKKYQIKTELQIPGIHNVENALAAIIAAIRADVPVNTIKSVLRTFTGVEHRIEFVRKFKGVKYINDSKSTNVDSTRVALETVEKNLWLILGGQDKGAPYAPLKKLLKKKVKAVMLIGEASQKISKELAGATKLYYSGNIKTAVAEIRKLARPGDTALLSPACASFDQFKNFEHRGIVFKKIIKAL